MQGGQGYVYLAPHNSFLEIVGVFYRPMVNDFINGLLLYSHLGAGQVKIRLKEEQNEEESIQPGALYWNRVCYGFFIPW